MSQPYKRPRLSSVKLLDFDVTLRSSASFTDPRVGSSQAIKLGGKTIEILVGESKSAYYVHEQVICSSSEFFRNAMKPEWAERKENPRQIELLDENGAMFEFYMQWLYSKKLPTLDNQAWVRPGHTHQHHGEFTHLARAYVLGEKLLDNDFKNTLIDAMIAMTLSDSTEGRYYPRGSPIKIIYDGTPESSPARRLLVDFWVWRADERWLDATDQVPEDFHHDLLRGLLSSRARLHGTKPWADFPETYYS